MPISSYPQLIASILLSRQPHIGAKSFSNWVKKYGSPLNALQAYDHQVGWKHSRSKSSLTLPSEKELNDQNISFVCYQEPSYPNSFYALSEPPPYLFFRGILPSTQMLSIIGTRHPSEEGKKLAQRFSIQAIEFGWTIVTGGASGIETEVLKSAIQKKGKVVVLLAHGVNKAYPTTNQTLFEQVLEQNGCLLSEFLPNTDPRPSFFPTRNRLIAGLSQAVLWIEGDQKSGACTTARHTLQLKKRLFVSYGSSPTLQQGPKFFLKKGAISLVSREEFQILDDFFSNSETLC